MAATVRKFNAAVLPGAFDHTKLDGCRTHGLSLGEDELGAEARYAAIPRLSAASGHHVHLSGRESGRASSGPHERRRSAENIFAAGEIMAGNILGKGYLAGFGMTIGTVFGRIAGREAARAAQ